MHKDLTDIKVFAFDLDGTLYQTQKPLELQILPSVRKVVGRITGQSEADVSSTISKFRVKYGGYVLGLIAEYGADGDSVVSEVYSGIDRGAVVTNEALVDQLRIVASRWPIIVITNSGMIHAVDCLNRLGVSGSVTRIFSFESSKFVLKPDLSVFASVADELEVSARSILYFDDSVRNVHAAHRMGMKTVLVSNGVAAEPYFYEMHLQVNHFAPPYVIASGYSIERIIENLLL